MRAVEKRLRERVKVLEADVEELKADRELFREHFRERFRWWIKLLGENSTPVLPWLIEDEAKWLRRFKWFSW
jgi:hypothetical protein